MRRLGSLVVMLAMVAVAGTSFAACGGSSAGPAASSSVLPSATPTTAPSTSASATAAPIARLAVRGSLLVVRKTGKSWTLWRVTPSASNEVRIAVLPFAPSSASVSLDGSQVFYLNSGSKICVVDTASGQVHSVSFRDYPIRFIDGATWISNREIVFGGDSGSSGWSDPSSLYVIDTATLNVTPFHGLAGAEPDYARQSGSLVFVTRRALKKPPYPYRTDGAGTWAEEGLHVLPSTSAVKAELVLSRSVFVDAGRQFDTPMVSPDGRYVLNSVTGSDVSVTYQLLDVEGSGETYLSLSMGSLRAVAWVRTKVAFQGSQELGAGGRWAVFVYDTATGSLTRRIEPRRARWDWVSWSPIGDLAIGTAYLPVSDVLVARGRDRTTWVKVTTGLLPVWVK